MYLYYPYRMYRTLVIIFGVLGFIYVEGTNVSRCTRHAGDLPISTQIEGCATPPCSLPQLEDVVLNIQFISPRNIQSMRTLATAYISIIPIPYDLGENADTCKHVTNPQCPLKAGDVVSYTLRMYIEPFFPVGTSTTVEFRAVDQGNDAVFCLRVPIRIVRPRNSVQTDDETLKHGLSIINDV